MRILSTCILARIFAIKFASLFWDFTTHQKEGPCDPGLGCDLGLGPSDLVFFSYPGAFALIGWNTGR